MATRFGAYEILHELKSGGMGDVLLGRRRGPGAFEQIVAIKTIRPEFASTPAVRAMFLDEAAILARLAHPGIATVHDFGEEGGTLYMVMEYVAGTSLRSLTGEPLPPGVAARLIAEACRGLHAAHEARDTGGGLLGVVHRDISPDNLMLGFDGHVKVIDFGIALVKNRQAPVTELGMVKGKPPYMSPEQVKNEAMDRRSDVFSLGVVLHELITGRALFEGDSIYAIARAVEHQPIAPPSQILGTSLPPGLDAAVMSSLARDPAWRTPAAAQLAEELERVIAAAGDETLEIWAERELGVAREAHRRWIAGVIAGKDAPKPVLGRATGAVNAVTPAPDALAKTALPEPAPPRRRSVLLPILAVLLLVAGVLGVLALTSGGAPATPDAPVVAHVADAPHVVDAEIVDTAVEVGDAAADASRAVPAIDAGRRTPDAGGVRLARDAAIVVPAVDAAVPQVTGTGYLVVQNPTRSGYVNVILDGRPIGPSPISKRSIPAGAHTIECIPPVGDETYKTTFDLPPGETKVIRPPI